MQLPVKLLCVSLIGLLVLMGSGSTSMVRAAGPHPVRTVDVVIHIVQLTINGSPGDAKDGPEPYVTVQCLNIDNFAKTAHSHAAKGRTGWQENVLNKSPTGTYPVDATDLHSRRIILRGERANCPLYNGPINGGPAVGDFVRMVIAVYDKDPGIDELMNDDMMIQSTRYDYQCPGPTRWTLGGPRRLVTLRYDVACFEKGTKIPDSGALTSRFAPRTVESNMVFSMNLTVDVNEAFKPSTLSVVEIIPEGFGLAASFPAPSIVERRNQDDASPYLLARWDFTQPEVVDRTIELQIVAPPYGTVSCGDVTDIESVQAQETVAVYYDGHVVADGVVFATSGPPPIPCVQVLGTPILNRIPDPLGPADIPLPGTDTDVDGDGVVTQADLDLVSSLLGLRVTCPDAVPEITCHADVDNDLDIDSSDAQVVSSFLGALTMGDPDVEGDGDVDLDDLIDVYLSQFSPVSNDYLAHRDLDNDRDIDLDDLVSVYLLQFTRWPP